MGRPPGIVACSDYACPWRYIGHARVARPGRVLPRRELPVAVEWRQDEIASTPASVFEGGFRMTGAQDYDVFASVTRRLLARRDGEPQIAPTATD